LKATFNNHVILLCVKLKGKKENIALDFID